MTSTRETESRTRRAVALAEKYKQLKLRPGAIADFSPHEWELLTQATFPNDKYHPSENTRAMVAELLKGEGL
jgi:hypothetical protein